MLSKRDHNAACGSNNQCQHRNRISNQKGKWSREPWRLDINFACDKSGPGLTRQRQRCAESLEVGLWQQVILLEFEPNPFGESSGLRHWLLELDHARMRSETHRIT